MTGLETALIIGAGIIAAFTLGFLFGVGYQMAEDRHALASMARETKKVVESMKDRSLKAIEEAYQERESREKQKMVDMVYNIFDDDDVKFGGF